MVSKSLSDERARLTSIKQILSLHRNSSSKQIIQVGVGEMDDAALVKISEDQSLVIASDFIRGSGFYLFEMGYLNYYDIGYYLVVANLSDIAAMGAKPVGLTTIFRYNEDVTDQQFEELFRGMKAASDTFEVEIVGGDTGSYVSNVLAATAFGLVHTEQALLRRNVKEGDLLCVTGVIGRPITALLYFKIAKIRGFQLSPEEEERILLSWKRPVARVQEGILLSTNGLANACQDISDGLKATIEQLSILSGKTFSVYIEEAEQFKEDLVRLIARRLSNVIVCEHGPVVAQSSGGSCIDHAHLHLFPTDIDLFPHLSQTFPYKTISGLHDLSYFHHIQKSYIYYEKEARAFSFEVDRSIPSQYIRRILWKQEGRADDWDWGVSIGYEQIIDTVRNLRQE